MDIAPILTRLEYDGGFSGCWRWTGSHISTGYGNIWREGRWYLVHRVMYEHYVGPIPDGLHIDHLCRVRDCCNPIHLEAVTPAENNRRSAFAKVLATTHCPNGHEYTEANVYERPDRPGSRQCRQCHKERSLEYYYRSRER